jgi:pyrroloquinoline quinone biosynthesis protein E
LIEPPYTLVAELTYRCPLRCAYCSNPAEASASRAAELDTASWIRIFREAEEMGVLQVHLTGGEPLVRADLAQLVEAARDTGMYVHLVTSGVPLTRERLRELRDRGQEALQLSFQDVDPHAATAIAGTDATEQKLKVAAWATELGIVWTFNVVLHRHNIDRVDQLIALAERLGAARIELANAQYLGWALTNRATLLPTREQVDNARAVARAARQRLAGRLQVVFVLPDYHTGVPRPCMDGWGRRTLLVAPDGLSLPCHGARSIAGLAFPSARELALRSIWYDSAAFAVYRGDAWLPAECRTCEQREIDHGGCRCQAYELTGDASAVDPVCARSPLRTRVDALLADAEKTTPRPPYRLRMLA